MPYRRLPNTDQARLRALRNVLKESELQDFNDPIVKFKSIIEAKNFLNFFEKQLSQYQQTLESQVNANKKYQQIVHNVRIYLSHFIQVFNLSVIRGEIKKEHKLLYQLDPDNHTVPDLSTENNLIAWGKNIIDGEYERVRMGGLPIYNPAIAKVKVHYEVFKEYKATQRLHQNTTNRNWEDLVKLRIKADGLILDIWNQIETKHRNLKPYSRYMECKKSGVIYYYRKGEKELTPADDEI